MTGGGLVPNLLLFGGLLRRCGLDVPPSRMVDAVRALEWVGLRRRGDAHAALRTLLVSRQSDLALFDRAFDLFWRHRTAPGEGPALFSLGERPRVVPSRTPASNVGLDDEGPQPRAGEAGRLAFGAYSAAEVSRTKDFAEWTPEELARAESLFADPAWLRATRRTRRWGPRGRGPVDLRRAMRRSMSQAGELVELPRRARLVRPRPIVVIADVSGSMERYSRMLLQFVHGLAKGPHRVEAFTFATRLTRITREAAGRRQQTLASISRAVHDWGGGTRIGEALRAFNVGWARRVMRHGPVVIVVSDGWDRGDPALLARELARVRRTCRRLVWLNPLLGSASYEPLTRGMQAALRHVDDFLPAHNLASLEDLRVRLAALR